ncbi:MAG: SLBB domain-containing protein [Limnoraphis sp. WC205]|nr:SLBB domain-containing protein [Limnoraphis sp. WC205]
MKTLSDYQHLFQKTTIASITLLGFSMPLFVGVEGAKAQFLPPPPVPVPTPTVNPAPAPISEGYILGIGDRVQIDIFNVPEYSGPNGQHQVSVDGALNLPLVGTVPVQGLTTEQATEAIKQRYAEYLQRPIISLTLLSARPMQIAIAGEVQSPGAYTFSGIAGGNAMPGSVTPSSGGLQLPRVTQLLQMAGGVTALADIRQVKIRRKQPGSTVEQILSVDLWELLQTGDLRQDISLRDGDTVYIPTVTDLDRVEARQVAVANFASSTSQPISVAVVGAVNRPGTHTLAASQTTPGGFDPENPQQPTASPSVEGMGVFTVTRAIKTAGGITAMADIRNIEVRRLSRTGTEQVISVDLWSLLQEGDLTQDIVLQQGDTIVVPTATTANFNQSDNVAMASFSPDAVKISVVGEVMRPGPIQVPPNTSLNQALAAAGGFNQSRANTKSVELIRVNANGTVVRQTIAVDMSQEVNEQNNPILRHNDVIVIGRSGSAAFQDGVGGVLGKLGPVNGIFGVLRFVGILD